MRETGKLNSVLCEASAAFEWGRVPSVVFALCAQSQLQWYSVAPVND